MCMYVCVGRVVFLLMGGISVDDDKDGKCGCVRCFFVERGV